MRFVIQEVAQCFNTEGNKVYDFWMLGPSILVRKISSQYMIITEKIYIQINVCAESGILN